MKDRTAFFLVVVGFLMVMGSVGGMDDPTKSDYLLEQLATAIAGLAIAWAGVSALQVNSETDYYEHR